MRKFSLRLEPAALEVKGKCANLLATEAPTCSSSNDLASSAGSSMGYSLRMGSFAIHPISKRSLWRRVVSTEQCNAVVILRYLRALERVGHTKYTYSSKLTRLPVKFSRLVKFASISYEI